MIKVCALSNNLSCCMRWSSTSTFLYIRRDCIMHFTAEIISSQISFSPFCLAFPLLIIGHSSSKLLRSIRSSFGADFIRLITGFCSSCSYGMSNIQMKVHGTSYWSSLFGLSFFVPS